VGAVVGKRVGVPEGEVEGETEGAAVVVGATLIVGDELGSTLATTVGRKEGAAEGTSVTPAVGSALARPVGRKVGAVVGVRVIFVSTCLEQASSSINSAHSNRQGSAFGWKHVSSVVSCTSRLPCALQSTLVNPALILLFIPVKFELRLANIVACAEPVPTHESV
jgi:hypothetical protein